MINGIIDVQKMINKTLYLHSFAIDTWNYARSCLLMAVEIDNRLNQLQYGLIKLESDVSNIY